MVDPGVMPAGHVVCPRCGRAVPENQTYYDEDGEICGDCFNTADLIQKNVKMMKSLCSGSLAMGILGFFCSFWGILPLLAVLGGISALGFPKKATSESRRVLDAMGGYKAMAIIGIVLGGICLVLVALMFLGMVASFGFAAKS